MHANVILLQRLYTSLDEHDHEAMAACYHPQATFADIAFELHGGKQIHAMWHMICQPDDHTSDIRATFSVVRADDHGREANLVDDYTFSSTARKVHNVIDSRFRFEDGMIFEHHDVCDARAWAEMAIGGVGGFLAGRLRILRSFKAQRMLREFVKGHPEYQ